MNFARALRVNAMSCIAFVGAGGKTSAIFQTARGMNSPVLVTASTHLGVDQVGLADHAVTITRLEDVDRAFENIEGVTLLIGPEIADQRVGGLDFALLERVFQYTRQAKIPLLIEADGSRQKPMKAPAGHEPAIPPWVNQVVVCQGMSALGAKLTDAVVHRPAIVAQISGVREGKIITPEGIANLFTHPRGGKKNIPLKAKTTALLNQVETPLFSEEIMRVANSLTNHFNQIIISSTNQQQVWAAVENTAAIILAAGASTRFGKPKILLDWRGKPLIRKAVEDALLSGLSQVTVVIGAVVDPVIEILRGLPVNIVVNERWQEGQSASIQAGLAALRDDAGSAIFLLADQPAVSPELLRRLIERHAATLAPIVAPRVQGKRGNPVLFDRDLFAELLQIQGDTGGRVLMNRYGLEHVDWDDPRLLLDIDTPEDYQKLLELTGE